MRVVVVTNRVPFVHGGAEELCEHLVRNMRRLKVDAEAFRIPFTWEPAERLIEEMLISRSLRLWHIDRVIGLKFPAYLIPHPNKVFWLLHQYRQAYDLWDAGQSNIPADARGKQIQSAIRQADNLAFAEAQAIYTNSPTTSRRLRHYNGFVSTVLAPPLNDPELFTGGESEGYIFAGGRISAGKRQTLLIRALRYAPRVRLVVAGPPDTSHDADLLRQQIAQEGVEDRVHLDARFLSRREMAQLVNQSLAVAYLPFDEDSVGYVTMEAFQAGKAVITTSDAGGVLEIVKHGETGLVARPDPRSLGAALRKATSAPARTVRMGRTGREALSARGLDWTAVVERLLT